MFTTFCIPLLNLHLVYYPVFEVRFYGIRKSLGSGAEVTPYDHTSDQPPAARAAVYTFVIKNTQKIRKKDRRRPGIRSGKYR
jgi:hypothetical protein